MSQKTEYNPETMKVVRQCLDRLKQERRNARPQTLREMGVEMIRPQNEGFFPVDYIL